MIVHLSFSLQLDRSQVRIQPVFLDLLSLGFAAFAFLQYPASGFVVSSLAWPYMTVDFVSNVAIPPHGRSTFPCSRSLHLSQVFYVLPPRFVLTRFTATLRPSNEHTILRCISLIFYTSVPAFLASTSLRCIFLTLCLASPTAFAYGIRHSRSVWLVIHSVFLKSCFTS